MTPLMPRKPVPALSLPTLGGDNWNLADSQPQHFTLLVFYRGLHCPKCKLQLQELTRLASQFEEKGVTSIAISGDGEERAKQAQEDWELAGFPIAYGLSIEQAREWGLYVSTGRGKTSIGIEEPAMFSEPGLFLVRPDDTLYAAMTQTMPFARPLLRELLGSLDFILGNDYPARGEA